MACARWERFLLEAWMVLWLCLGLKWRVLLLCGSLCGSGCSFTQGCLPLVWEKGEVGGMSPPHELVCEWQGALRAVLLPRWSRWLQMQEQTMACTHCPCHRSVLQHLGSGRSGDLFLQSRVLPWIILHILSHIDLILNCVFWTDSVSQTAKCTGVCAFSWTFVLDRSLPFRWGAVWRLPGLSRAEFGRAPWVCLPSASLLLRPSDVCLSLPLRGGAWGGEDAGQLPLIPCAGFTSLMSFWGAVWFRSSWMPLWLSLAKLFRFESFCL